MPLNWPLVAGVAGDLPETLKQRAIEALNRFGTRVHELLNDRGLPDIASPVFGAWDLVVVVDGTRLIAAFATSQGGVLEQRWIHKPDASIDGETVARQMEETFGSRPHTVLTLPREAMSPGQGNAALEQAARGHVETVDLRSRIRLLGDLEPFPHRIKPLQTFLNDHPDPSRNVFIMMSFADDSIHTEIIGVIRSNLKRLGYVGIRADERDYTGDLWGNVETCLLGCLLGVAVFEQLGEAKDKGFNPNVSIELGYMLGRGRRCLILKERDLGTSPADIIHKLYRPFDGAKVNETVSDELTRWVERDLGLT